MPTALIIGDSHVDHSPMAAEMKRLLEAKGLAVTVAGVGATSALTWLNQNPVCRPNRDWCVDVNTLPKRPDWLLVSLGTNDAANMAVSNGHPEPIVSNVRKLIARFAPKSSIWIGPPWLGDKVTYYTNQDNERLYAAAARAGVPIFDSRIPTRSFVEAGSGDGVHLGPVGQKAWAVAVVKEMQKKTIPWLPIAGVAVATFAAMYLLYTPRDRWFR